MPVFEIDLWSAAVGFLVGQLACPAEIFLISTCVALVYILKTRNPVEEENADTKDGDSVFGLN